VEAVVGLAGLIGGKPKLSPQELRKAKPLQASYVEAEALPDGSIVLSAPLAKQGRGILAAFARASKKPATKQFELEPVGAFVWDLCDGNHTFEGIARKLREKFKMNRLEAETALEAFLRMLVQRRLVILVVKSKK
jgi:hypothetical protein